MRADMTDARLVQQVEGTPPSGRQRLDRHPVDRTPEPFDRLVKRAADIPAGDGAAEGPIEMGVRFGEHRHDQMANLGHAAILARETPGSVPIFCAIGVLSLEGIDGRREGTATGQPTAAQKA
jgi:hypothetical protein